MSELKTMAKMMTEAGENSQRYDELSEACLVNGDLINYREYKRAAEVEAARAAGLYAEIKSMMA